MKYDWSTGGVVRVKRTYKVFIGDQEEMVVIKDGDLLTLGTMESIVDSGTDDGDDWHSTPYYRILCLHSGGAFYWRRTRAEKLEDDFLYFHDKL